MIVLVTGGAGYIGSHTCVELLAAGHQVVILDNFSNSHPEAIARIEQLTGQSIPLIHGDIRDEPGLENLLRTYGCDAVIHFAGLKSINESIQIPLEYYDHNVAGTLCLLRAMQKTGVKTLIFSSSATVYGDPRYLPLTEDHPLQTTHPYGKSKWIVEDILRNLYEADPSWHFGILRYFNPVGAHASGLIGEDPQGTPSNLMPFLAQVAIGRHPKLQIWGHDYPTPDGTGVRDYIHVVDLALGHLHALKRLTEAQCFTVNLGTGRGYSVLEVVHAFEKASGRSIPYQFAARRPGDIASCYADPRRAAELLGWTTRHCLETMCADHWRWQSNNPEGYL